MRLSYLLSLLASPVFADVPVVVTDVAPVHSLVSQVMAGVGEPVLLVDPGASPHTYALRPSEARALQDADLIFWVGEALTPWLEGPISALADHGLSIELLDIAGTHLIENADAKELNGDDHGDDHGHDHGALDPHAWLDPENAGTWMVAIAARLSAMDPAHADAYRENAQAGIAAIADARNEASKALQEVSGAHALLLHDTLSYFQNAFQTPRFDAISMSDAQAPGAAQIANLRAQFQDDAPDCAFVEPQLDRKLLATVLDGYDVPIGEIDPLGAKIPLGPELYPALILSLVQSLAICR